MLDELISNKYFVIALIIALILVLYLYSRKKSCELEGMKNIDLTPLSTNRNYNNKRVKQCNKNERDNDNDNGQVFNSDRDNNNNNNNNNNNYRVIDRDEKFKTDKNFKKYLRKRLRSKRSNYPRPLNDRPDLSQCQPCICPGGKKGFRLNELDFDDDSDSDDNDDNNNDSKDTDSSESDFMLKMKKRLQGRKN